MFEIDIGGRITTASLTDESHNTETREAVRDALPLEGKATKWGDELYFDVPVNVPPKETTTEVPVGSVAYWHRGNALCFFWGPTPASDGDEPRAASPVNVFARVDDISVFEGAENGVRVRVEGK